MPSMTMAPNRPPVSEVGDGRLRGDDPALHGRGVAADRRDRRAGAPRGAPVHLHRRVGCADGCQRRVARCSRSRRPGRQLRALHGHVRTTGRHARGHGPPRRLAPARRRAPPLPRQPHRRVRPARAGGGRGRLVGHARRRSEHGGRLSQHRPRGRAWSRSASRSWRGPGGRDARCGAATRSPGR